jgi:hypothetical protein
LCRFCRKILAGFGTFLNVEERGCHSG